MNGKFKAIAFAALLGLRALNPTMEANAQEAGNQGTEHAMSREEHLTQAALKTLETRGREFLKAMHWSDDEVEARLEFYRGRFRFWLKALKETEEFKDKDVKFVIDQALVYAYRDASFSQEGAPQGFKNKIPLGISQ